MRYFSDKVVIVTGGAGGIGAAMVRALAQQGSRVVIADFNYTAAETLATELCAMGYGVSAMAVDVRDREAIERLVQQVVARYRRLDLMINNAGIVIVSEMEDTLDEDWDQLIDINLKGVVYGCRAAFKQMRKQGFGQILNTASASALAPTPLFAAYSSVKHAVLGLTLATRIEGAAYNIKVSALCPGVVKAPVARGSAASRGLQRSKLERGTPFMLTPFKAAKTALKGLRKNKAVIPVGMDSYLPYWANRFMPQTYSFVLQKSMWLIRRYLRS